MPNPQFLGYLDDTYMDQPYMQGTGLHSFGSQVELLIQNISIGSEVELTIADQVKANAFEIRFDRSISHHHCSALGYLQEPYMEDPYLSDGICASMGWEVDRVIKASEYLGLEVELHIADHLKPLASEVLLKIADAMNPVGMEINQITAFAIGFQCRLVLYNSSNLRILTDFSSRGTSGVNWTSTSTAAGDFSPNNLNTDIVEQVWRSINGDKVVVLTCDTEVVPQGVAIDTLAILNHNLTQSAIITVEGSDNAGFVPIEQTFNVPATSFNAYYIAPAFPTLTSRYWRLQISDITNPNNYLQIGTILFGTSIIFQGECFTDNVIRKWIHFADKIQTEGYTNVTNDRALKRAVSLEFRMLDYSGGNYRALNEIFEYNRTTLKCLWIPDPQDPTRFAVFGKLAVIPDETHRNLGDEASDTLDLMIDVDESL